jgi:hypothetical protein
VSAPTGVFERLKARGEEVFSKVSNELMANPQFLRALQGAMKGKEKLDEAVAKALKNMNIPTRTEFKKAVRRIEALEAEVAELKARAAKPAPRQAARRAAARKAPARRPSGAGSSGT